jgi:hypothetical protein
MIAVKRILLIILLIYVGSINLAEGRCTREIRGKLITATYDTLDGFIKKVSDRKSLSHIEFRSLSDMYYVDMYPEQMEAFISDEFSILSFKIRLNNVERYVLIKKIYDGSLDLYYSWVDNNSDLINDCNDLFFVGFSDGRIIQMKKRYLIETLQAIFIDCDVTLQKIKPEKFDYYYYKDKKLINLFATYNDCAHQPMAYRSKVSVSSNHKP